MRSSSYSPPISTCRLSQDLPVLKDQLPDLQTQPSQLKDGEMAVVEVTSGVFDPRNYKVALLLRLKY